MPRGKPFKKGQKRPANSGRKKGTKNKKTIDREKEFQELAQFIREPEYRASVRRRAIAGRAPHLEKFILAKEYGNAPLEIKVDKDTREAIAAAAELLTSRIVGTAARLGAVQASS